MSMLGDHHKIMDEEDKIKDSKEGEYTGDVCPNCHRMRVMLSDDKKKRCEKCKWCLDDNEYDSMMHN